MSNSFVLRNIIDDESSVLREEFISFMESKVNKFSVLIEHYKTLEKQIREVESEKAKIEEEYKKIKEEKEKMRIVRQKLAAMKLDLQKEKQQFEEEKNKIKVESLDIDKYFDNDSPEIESEFHDVYKKTKQTKNRLIELINNTFDCPIRCGPLHPTRYMFCMNEDYNSPQFQSTFCLKCGNFTFPIPRVASNNVKCHCH